jgi:hypothetical protein
MSGRTKAMNYEDKFQVVTTKETRRIMEDLLFRTMKEEGCLIKKAEAFERIVQKMVRAEGLHV